ncbi:unnamed protein product [Menidia menidia]|uniref:(Atlantic silverside) hypothetical protein n=1 Tax=Menidia menidia TaxID=238744 RepID=A0A8S4BDR0_9TELE|nr:unnamed protein product [Menidia menidia]
MKQLQIEHISPYLKLKKDDTSYQTDTPFDSKTALNRWTENLPYPVNILVIKSASSVADMVNNAAGIMAVPDTFLINLFDIQVMLRVLTEDGLFALLPMVLRRLEGTAGGVEEDDLREREEVALPILFKREKKKFQVPVSQTLFTAKQSLWNPSLNTEDEIIVNIVFLMNDYSPKTWEEKTSLRAWLFFGQQGLGHYWQHWFFLAAAVLTGLRLQGLVLQSQEEANRKKNPRHLNELREDGARDVLALTFSSQRAASLSIIHTDSDEGEGNIKYTISGEGAGSIFIIDELTGDIHATERLDREEKAFYTLRAQARDRLSNDPLEPESEFVIKVQDINDSEPQFLEGPYIGSVAELSPIEQLLLN